MADGAPVLPMLEAPVPLMVDQLVDVPTTRVRLLHVPAPQTVDSVVEVLKILDNSLPDVEQVIEVPKIFSDVIPSRSSVSEPQLAEQLVEVPTDRVYLRDIIAVRLYGMDPAFALSRRLRGDTARPGRYTNTGRRDDG